MKTLTTPAFVLLSFAIVLILPLAAIPQTAVPMLINYQGDLTSPSTGEPVPDGSYDMLLRIYDIESEGAPLWEGTHTDTNGNPVQVTRGILSVILGSGAGNELSSSIFNGADRWLEIQVGAETLLPRQRITSVAYSLVSENSRFLGGNQVSDFVIQADGLRLQPNAISPNLIGGHQNNTVTDGVAGATVGGGGTRFSSNRVTDDLGTVGGGEDNQAGDNAGTTGDARCATVGGGWSNTASANYTSVGGGQSNTAGDSYATVAGGYSNDASGSSATVGGGYSNTASGSRATVAGGYSNDASGSSATVGGGYSNTAGDSYATVAGGYNNAASGSSAAVAGGYSNVASGDYATVAGGWSNQATASYATIAGGGPSDPNNPSTTRNLVTDNYGTIGGGGDNQAGDNAGTTTDSYYATVAGGRSNEASGQYATVGGGYNNTASEDQATVGGGLSNTASSSYATVGGGERNTASGDCATVAGGRSNVATASYATVAGGGPSDPNNALTTRNLVTDNYGTIGGGGDNQAGDNAGTTGDRTFATVGGGNNNTASHSYTTVGGGMNNAASGYQSTVSGGYSNDASGDGSAVCGGRDNTASGLRATVPAGYKNTAAGDYSFAAGRRAQAIHDGAFVWGDSQDADVVSTANNQVTFRCGGGVRFRSGSLGANQDLSWAPGNASWTFASDRNLKENFVEIDPKEVLERVSRLPITQWNFKGYTLRHIGPVAQDFHALFPLGGSETMIDSGDLHGISLAAIQGLHEMLREKDTKISTLEARIAALESLVEKLVESQAGGK